MQRLLWNMLLVSPLLGLAQFGLTESATAKDIQTDLSSTTVETIASERSVELPTYLADTNLLQQMNRYGREGNSDRINQVTNVNQLRDVSPGDWAFEALRNLVERYGCIAGYPSGVYLGNRAMTRYEFAAGLNACLGQIERLIASSTTDFITRDDLATLEQLVSQFEGELATLGTRVDDLETRVATLEGNQFSTTTKLEGEVVFALADVFGGNNLNVEDSNNTVFQDRVRLNFVSSFTGSDALYTRLDAANATNFNNIGNQGALTYTTSPNGNNVVLGWLAYYFDIGENIHVYLPAAFPLWQDFVPTVSPYLEGYTGATASLSSFGESSPIYKIGLASGGGVGINFDLGEQLVASAGYFGGDSFDPSDSNGLFNGEFAALAQLTWTPGDIFQIAATYVRSYHPGADSGIFDLGIGTTNAVTPFGAVATSSDSFGAEAAFKVTDTFSINGFFGLTQANQESGGDAEADILYYGVGLAFPDLGKEGNLLGLIAGAEPYIDDCDNNGTTACQSTGQDPAYHFEAFYKFQVNDNISITPGVVWLANPEGVDDNDDVFIGALRTTFTF